MNISRTLTKGYYSVTSYQTYWDLSALTYDPDCFFLENGMDDHRDKAKRSGIRDWGVILNNWLHTYGKETRMSAYRLQMDWGVGGGGGIKLVFNRSKSLNLHLSL